MRPESANPETPDEIIAMITFAGSPELQEQLRSLCREYIDIFPARTGRPNGYRNRSNEVGGAAQPPPSSTPFSPSLDRTKWSQAHPVPKGDGQW